MYKNLKKFGIIKDFAYLASQLQQNIDIRLQTLQYFITQINSMKIYRKPSKVVRVNIKKRHRENINMTLYDTTEEEVLLLMEKLFKNYTNTTADDGYKTSINIREPNGPLTTFSFRGLEPEETYKRVVEAIESGK